MTLFVWIFYFENFGLCSQSIFVKNSAIDPQSHWKMSKMCFGCFGVDYGLKVTENAVFSLNTMELWLSLFEKSTKIRWANTSGLKKKINYWSLCMSPGSCVNGVTSLACFRKSLASKDVLASNVEKGYRFFYSDISLISRPTTPNKNGPTL